jgi:hypothetical protein
MLETESPLAHFGKTLPAGGHPLAARIAICIQSTSRLLILANCANNARAMAEPTNTTLPTTDRPDVPPPVLPLFRFGLRHLFWFVTVVSVLFAAAVAISPGVAPLLLWITALIVAAHITGTALGSRLRAHADQVRDWEGAHPDARRSAPDAAERSCDLAAATLPPPSPWHLHKSTALGWVPRLVVVGAVCGGCGGAAFLVLTIGHRTSPVGIAVGAVSLAVIGGWLAFVGGSFYAIFRHGLRDAMAHQRLDEARGKWRR